MSKPRTKGPKPSTFWEGKELEILTTLNAAAAGLVGDLTAATPVGIGGKLRGSWVMKPATPNNYKAIVGNSRSYLLPVEMGRQPGKGISLKGQESVALWAKRKLGVDEFEAEDIASALSFRYKRDGRFAEGFMGLAKPGTKPSGPPKDDINPVRGSLLDNTFRNLTRDLNKL